MRRLQQLRQRPDLAARLLYLDCDTETLQRRYTESRRPHPLAPDRPVVDGIVEERRQIGWVRDSADVVIDTSALSPHQFKQILAGHFALERAARRAHRGDVVLLPPRPAARGRPGVRRALPQEPALRAGAEAAYRPRPAGGRLHRHRSRLRAVHRPAGGDDRAAAAPFRRRGQELSDHRRGLHGRPTPLDRGRRTTGRTGCAAWAARSLLCTAIPRPGGTRAAQSGWGRGV